ncbi:Protein kinase domain-containing protein [Tumidithrix helvetica PCC 7403]|uniref:AAA-like domain-containing protein n=1 Tax=Tumidithrix helvetica TaxID=3457545 RepID=UPI003CA1BE6B
MTSSEIILAGRYQIISPLGGGGFGQTFLAKDNQLPGDPFCVVKQLKPKFENPQDLEIAKRLFEREAKMLHHLGGHDQIPRLFAHFEQDGEFYLVQEFVEGQALSNEIIEGKQWSQAEVIAFLHDSLQVLAFVHSSQVIHRDIKPANLMRRSRDRKIILIDFGAVKALGTKGTPRASNEQTSTHTVVIGSLGYMPNEQLAGNPQFSSDIYAIGMVCLQALTGLKDCLKIPKDSRTSELIWQDLVHSISPQLTAIIDKMVRYDYRQRFENAIVALNALSGIFANCNKTTVITNLERTQHIEEPDGQVAINSTFYVDRPPIEQDCFEAVTRSGSLIRIKAPRKMGKSSLLSRILDCAKERGDRVVHLYFQQADSDVFGNLDSFLQWFCASIASELEVEEKLDEYWKGILGSKNKCTKYFQRYLLAESSTPLVLGLDEVDLTFQYPDIAADFLGLLRAWHEKAKNEEIWKRLRLVIVHSKDAYIPLNINQSPFNVGIPVELPEFTRSQTENLICKHNLQWNNTQIESLINLVGGHPYLLRLALYQLARNRLTLDRLLNEAATEAGIYGDHLRRHLANIEEDCTLVAAMKQLSSQRESVRLETETAFTLRSMGLVKFQGNNVVLTCDLYRQYFQDRLK